MPTKYIKEQNALTKEEYINLLKAYRGKILAITGKSNVQANYRTLEELSSLERTTIYTPEQVNHLLKEIEEKPDILNVQKQYKKTFKKPIHQGTQETIEKWLKQI